MDTMLKASGMALVALVLCLALNKQGKDFTLLLTLATCCMLAFAALRYLEPVMDFFQQLQELGQLDGQMIEIMLKVVGIGLISQICSMICTDAGNQALAKSLQLLSSGLILWLSLPLYMSLLELIQNILEEIG